MTIVAVWQAVTVNRGPRSTWAAAREVFLLLILVVLAVLSVYWRIAGTTFDL